MAEEKKNCLLCMSTGTLQKIPSIFFLDSSKEQKTFVGEKVEQSIQEFREDLEIQKNDLRKEYDDTD